MIDRWSYNKLYKILVGFQSIKIGGYGPADVGVLLISERF